jgi:hypothetical protein
MASFRTIVEEIVVTEKIDAVLPNIPRLEEVIDGLKWRLSREPERGYSLPGENPPKYLYKIDPPATNFPMVTVLYEFDENEVHVLDIRFIPRNTGIDEDV